MSCPAPGGASASRAVLEFTQYLPDDEPRREALCTLGNGYFATRGAAPECDAAGAHYPGTYLAGVYDRLTSEVSGRLLENESLVNAPNWLPFTFRVDEGDWFRIDDVEIIEFRQRLELEKGILERALLFRGPDGRETRLEQHRLVSMAQPHLGALVTTIRAENWSGRLILRSLIDGGVANRGVERYRDLAGNHLEVLECLSGPTSVIRARTVQSRIEIAVSARLRLWRDGAPLDVVPEALDLPEAAGVELAVPLERGSTLRIEKVIAVFTSRDKAISEPGLAAREALDSAADFDQLSTEHGRAWSHIWEQSGVAVDADSHTRLSVDLYLFHLMQTVSANTIGLDVGIPARGLHGEAYRGHIFWDELFVFPLLYTRVPDLARSLLLYRYRRLTAARRRAREQGFRGAMFPWQSGSDGREESQVLHLNPRSGRWVPDDTHRQRHINIAVACNVWRYFETTSDVEFLSRYGAEMLIEIARFWASLATQEGADDRYDIYGVVGPDEFHTSDPNWDGPGLRNNAYTNVMAAWVLETATRVLEPLPSLHRRRLTDLLALAPAELENWHRIARRLRVPMHGDGIISQFQGYELLAELDWEAYRERYGDIQRLDRILEAEGDDINRYRASKQADVLMLLYLLSFEEVGALLDRLDVPFDEEMLARNVAYYLARTSHGSTLSGVVHSWVLARTDRRRSMEQFRRALRSDIDDIQGGTTQEGIHLGAMAGAVDMLERGYSGMEIRDGVLRFKPNLPHQIGEVKYRIYVQGRWLSVSIVEDERLELRSDPTARPPMRVECRGDRRSLGSGESVVFPGRG